MHTVNEEVNEMLTRNSNSIKQFDVIRSPRLLETIGGTMPQDDPWETAFFIVEQIEMKADCLDKKKKGKYVLVRRLGSDNAYDPEGKLLEFPMEEGWINHIPEVELVAQRSSLQDMRENPLTDQEIAQLGIGG